MEYHDFVVSIERDGPGAFRKRVLESPAGQASEPFAPPFPLEELSARLDSLGPDVKSGRVPREIGTALYQALFSGQVGALYAESRGHAKGGGRGLRIKLRFDPGSPGMAWVPMLPWELVFRPDTEEILATDLESPVVRYLEVPRSSALPVFEPPLRLLVALANPRGTDELDLEDEQGRLRKALGGRPGEIEPDFLEHATLEGIRAKLRSRHFHVLHFMGHGGWNPHTGEGGLVLETADRRPDLVSGSLLADTVKGTAMPVLAVLNACDTARSTGVEGASPFGGVAAALVRKGMPAVVAMQFPVTDEASLAFAGAFYSRIAAGDPVDTAVGEGRMAIRTAVRDSMEWATPVLFMRSPDGRLFETSRPASEVRPKHGTRIGIVNADQMNYSEGDIHQINNFLAEPPKR